MSKKLRMGIVGYGFVGKAVDYGFPDANCEKFIIDLTPGENIWGSNTAELSECNVDITFVCVPTPMGKDASIDASILIEVVKDALKWTDGLVVIKSTVVPSIIRRFALSNDRVIYNPEFLTEKAANEDFVNPIMHVFGGHTEITKKLQHFYEQYSSCAPCPIYHMSSEEASFVKYGMNSFLATKVLFFNQFFDIVESQGSNYSTIIRAIGTDSRIGISHTMVPGHDGRKGFGGSCFAKDTAAFARYAISEEKAFTVLNEAIKQNQKYRTAYGEPLEREKAQNIKFDYDI